MFEELITEDGFTSPQQFQGAPALDPIFSAKRVENTLTCGYFDIIGVLSRYPEGVEFVPSLCVMLMN